MGPAYSVDLRERAVGAVCKGGLSCHQAAAQFGVGISTAILWVQPFRRTGSRTRSAAVSRRRFQGLIVIGWYNGAGRGFHLARARGRIRREWPEGRLPRGVGVRPRRETQSQKKTLIAAEQDRPNVARRRAQWTKYRQRIGPPRLVFIDKTWTKTNMAPLRGRWDQGAAWPLAEHDLPGRCADQLSGSSMGRSMAKPSGSASRRLP
jgi:transposase-like protein